MHFNEANVMPEPQRLHGGNAELTNKQNSADHI
uniref:Uncharacterized protein n=1 Tax=Anguilla anguilla TaxID=7936 RepID=A0A0E9XCG7_ANGAN